MRVLLVDDHTLFRNGLTLLLSNLEANLEFFEFASCESFIRSSSGSFDLVLLDYTLPGTSGVEALNLIRQHTETAPIVVLSSLDEPKLIREIIDHGAAGFIPKSSTPEVLMAALKLVLAGGVYLPKHVLEDVRNMTAYKDNGYATETTATKNSKLSSRQTDVLQLAIQGKANKVIAHELHISEATVKAHMSAAFKILGVRNRTEAVFAVAGEHFH